MLLLTGKVCGACPLFTKCDGSNITKCIHGGDVTDCKDKCSENGKLADCLCLGEDFFSTSSHCLKCKNNFKCNGSTSVFCNSVKIPSTDRMGDYLCSGGLL